MVQIANKSLSYIIVSHQTYGQFLIWKKSVVPLSCEKIDRPLILFGIKTLIRRPIWSCKRIGKGFLVDVWFKIVRAVFNLGHDGLKFFNIWQPPSPSFQIGEPLNDLLRLWHGQHQNFAHTGLLFPMLSDTAPHPF